VPLTRAAETTAATAYLDAVLLACDRALTNMPAFITAGETIADRHIRGGAIGTYWGNQSMGPELYGRSGGMVNIGFDRIWKKERTPAEIGLDVAILGFDRTPTAADRKWFEEDKKRGCMMVGLGPRLHPDVAPYAAQCDVFLDTGFGGDDRVVSLVGTARVGHVNHVINALHGWMLTAETVAALTRRGKMPCMWKSYGWPDGKDWGNKYLFKQQFHDEYQVPPQPAGQLARRYVEAIRGLVVKLKEDELADIRTAGQWVGEEMKAARKVVVAWEGHMPEGYVALRDDRDWCTSSQLHLWLDSQREEHRKNTPDGALVIRLGTYGLDPVGPGFFKDKSQRWILVTGEHTKPEYKAENAGAPIYIALGFAFGDACVSIEGYPIPVFAPSGIMQAVAYEAILSEAVAYRLGAGVKQ